MRQGLFDRVTPGCRTREPRGPHERTVDRGEARHAV